MSRTDKELQHKKYLEKTNHHINALSIKKPCVILKGIRSVPSSSIAAIGNVDSFGLNEEARKWIKESTINAEDADEAFVTTKLKPKHSRMWSDTNVKDDFFEIDSEINDLRQKSAIPVRRTNKPTH